MNKFVSDFVPVLSRNVKKRKERKEPVKSLKFPANRAERATRFFGLIRDPGGWV